MLAATCCGKAVSVPSQGRDRCTPDCTLPVEIDPI